MILIYEPADGPVERYDLDDMAAAEAEAVERVTGKTWGEVEQGLQQQSPLSLRAVLWAWKKRTQPTLRFSEFDVPSWRRRLRARMSAEEIADYVQRVQREVDPEHPDYAQSLRELRMLAEDPEDVQRALGGQDPKAPSGEASPSAASATAG